MRFPFRLVAYTFGLVGVVAGATGIYQGVFVERYPTLTTLASVGLIAGLLILLGTFRIARTQNK